jgi:hypothetical protein
MVVAKHLRGKCQVIAYTIWQEKVVFMDGWGTGATGKWIKYIYDF